MPFLRALRYPVVGIETLLEFGVVRDIDLME
jgi:hypothetical protein